ncbi:MAG TPA: DUF262 domain-containing protein [Azospirillum sp.]|nr:DUF262 domain-containing protein [Azospirillum sp.]
MANQINPSVTNPTIADIYQSIESGRLILKPDFQRKFVWTHEHQEDFIDTILNGYPFPEIYVCRGDVDLKLLKTTQFVIDGQQRLTTIKRYIDGVHDKPVSKIPPFKDLGSKLEDFLTYKIVVRDIGNVSDETVREVFRRINLTKFKLEDIEIHNAIYDGAFIKTAKEILTLISLKSYGVFHDSEFTRMADLHFVLLVMSTIEFGGYFPEDNEVERNIAGNNEEYNNAEPMKKLLEKTFAVIDRLCLPADSMWFRKSNFFTMVVEIAKHIDDIPKDIADRLAALEETVMHNKRNSDNMYGRYYQYMYQGTNQRKARVIRSELFCHDIFGEPNPTT